MFITECIYLVLKSLWDWEPVERLKQRSAVISFMGFLALGEHSSECDKGYGLRKLAGQKEENYSSYGVTE